MSALEGEADIARVLFWATTASRQEAVLERFKTLKNRNNIPIADLGERLVSGAFKTLCFILVP